MPIYIDPQSRVRFLISKHIGDFEYTLPDTVSEEIRNESVPLIGSWKDYTGSDTTINSRNQQMIPVGNELQGTDAGLEGAKIPQLNSVGQTKATNRRRRKLFYVKLD